MKKASTNRLTEDQKAEIRAVEGLPDEQIDTTDIPEILDWTEAKRGVFYRPVKQQITLRLDADVVACSSDGLAAAVAIKRTSTMHCASTCSDSGNSSAQPGTV